MSWRRRLQLAAVGVLIVAYSGLSHYSNSHAQQRDLATLLALAPMLTLGLLLLWRWRGALTALLATFGVGLLGWHLWPLFEQNFSIVYLIQQLGFYGLMAATFGFSLLPGRQPFCTQLADKVHGPLGLPELRYTRQVTAAWGWFFIVNMAVTVLLYAFAPLNVWSLFVNFLALPLIGLMFAVEYAIRRQVLKQVHTGGLIATLRVYFANSR
jgi:uncharacterized membrane protein